MADGNNAAKRARIIGIPVPWYLLIFTIIMIGAIAKIIPVNFLTGFVFCMIFGHLLAWIGGLNKTVFYIGGPSLLCILLPTLLVYWGVLPAHLVDSTKVFYTGTMGYIEFFIAALICGSILSMDRDILIKAGSRYAIPLLLGIAFSFLGAGLVGTLTGYGFKEAISKLAIPIMGGGIGAGAIPISQIYGQAANIEDTSAILSMLMPAVTLANIFSILGGAVFNVLGRKRDRFFKGFSGEGAIMRTGEVYETSEEAKMTGATFVSLGVGLLMAGTLYIFGYLCRSYITSAIHPYAWTIIATAMLKIFNLLPRELEEGAEAWYGLMSHIGLYTILVCLSLVTIDIDIIIGAVTDPAYLAITMVVTLLAAIGAGIAGMWVKMYFVESAICAGLCMANAGGGGDVAVLGAANRMQLMPFAQISSRIGGAIILLIASLLAPYLV